jgi:hypothetical protein
MECKILLAFSRQKLVRQRPPLLGYMHILCVFFLFFSGAVIKYTVLRLTLQDMKLSLSVFKTTITEGGVREDAARVFRLRVEEAMRD